MAFIQSLLVLPPVAGGQLADLLGVNTEGVCFPGLPIVVQGGRVNGLRLSHDHIGQAQTTASCAKQPRFIRVLKCTMPL